MHEQQAARLDRTVSRLEAFGRTSADPLEAEVLMAECLGLMDRICRSRVQLRDDAECRFMALFVRFAAV